MEGRWGAKWGAEETYLASVYAPLVDSRNYVARASNKQALREGLVCRGAAALARFLDDAGDGLELRGSELEKGTLGSACFRLHIDTRRCGHTRSTASDEVRVESYVETLGCRPDAVASDADDAGLVDVAGANQACRTELEIRTRHGRRWVYLLRGMEFDGVPRVNISCKVGVLAPDPRS